jgi:hypothetical protein
MQIFKGPWVVSPPINSQPCASAKAQRPLAKPASQTSSIDGKAKAKVKAKGLAPQAAKSLRLTAKAL